MNRNPNRASVLGIADSLRSGSYNRALLRTAADDPPTIMRIHTFDLAAIPLYNYDIEQRGDPQPVVEFKQAIADADAVLIATPEYHSWVWARAVAVMPGLAPMIATGLSCSTD
jgi:chromate reductase